MGHGAHDAHEYARARAVGEAHHSRRHERDVQLQKRCRGEEGELQEAQQYGDGRHERHRHELPRAPTVRVLQLLVMAILRRCRHRYPPVSSIRTVRSRLSAP